MEGVRRCKTPSLIWVAIVSALVAPLVSGCSLEPQNGYVESADGSLSFRYPAQWHDVEIAPVKTEWVVAVDAADQPAKEHLAAFVVDDPFVVAQVYGLTTADRDIASLRSLRKMALTDGRDPTDAGDPTIRLLFHDAYLDDNGFEGHHLRFEVDLPNGTAVEEQFAAYDLDRKQIHRVRVACSLSCFEANSGAIEELFDSVRLSP